MLLFKKNRERESWLLASVLLNLFFSVVKLSWGVAVGATIIYADGIHSISDVVGAFLVFLALRFAGHKSGRFPLGMNKLEDLAALLGGAAILTAGYGILRMVFFDEGIKTPEKLGPTLILVSVIIVLETVFYLFERKAGKRLKSPGVRTDALNWLGDIGAGLVVMAGILGSHFSIPYAQEIAVAIIVLMIFYGAYEILRDAVLSLLDASADKETLQKAKTVIASFAEVGKIERLFIRRAGSVLFAEMVLQVKEKKTDSAHYVIDRIERELQHQIPNLAVVTIHYEPEKKPFKKIARLLEKDQTSLARTFGKAFWIELSEVNDTGEIVSRKMIENPVSRGQRGKAIKLAAWLIKQKVDRIVFHPQDLEEDLHTLFSALGIEIVEKMEEE
jgi:cation diffusion facilitator family transporter